MLTAAITVGGGATLGVGNIRRDAAGTTVTIGDGGTLVLNMGSGDPNFVDSGTVSVVCRHDRRHAQRRHRVDARRHPGLRQRERPDIFQRHQRHRERGRGRHGHAAFSGANTYTGDTRVQDGTLQIATGGGLPPRPMSSWASPWATLAASSCLAMAAAGSIRRWRA